MASGVRYRYNGSFVSAAKAQRLANLPNTRSKVTTEYVVSGAKSTVRRGYALSVEKQVAAALKASRVQAEEKRAEKAPSKKELERQRRYEEQRKEEQRKVIDLAEEADRYATKHDVSVEEALEALGYEEGDFDFYSTDDILGYISTYQDMGEDAFDFDMTDLEQDEDRIS
jgi:predicted Zn-dependent protease